MPPYPFLLPKDWGLFTVCVVSGFYVPWHSSCSSLDCFHFIHSSGVPKPDRVLQLSLPKTYRKRGSSGCESVFMPHNTMTLTTHYHLLIHYDFRFFSEKILLYNNFSSFICTVDIPTSTMPFTHISFVFHPICRSFLQLCKVILIDLPAFPHSVPTSNTAYSNLKAHN